MEVVKDTYTQDEVDDIREHAFGQGHAYGWANSRLGGKDTWLDCFKEYLKTLNNKNGKLDE